MGKFTHGLFHWNARGLYRPEDAIGGKFYAYSRAAEKAAAKLNEETPGANIVVRDVYLRNEKKR